MNRIGQVRTAMPGDFGKKNNSHFTRQFTWWAIGDIKWTFLASGIVWDEVLNRECGDA